MAAFNFSYFTRGGGVRHSRAQAIGILLVVLCVLTGCVWFDRSSEAERVFAIRGLLETHGFHDPSLRRVTFSGSCGRSETAYRWRSGRAEGYACSVTLQPRDVRAGKASGPLD